MDTNLLWLSPIAPNPKWLNMVLPLVRDADAWLKRLTRCSMLYSEGEDLDDKLVGYRVAVEVGSIAEFPDVGVVDLRFLQCDLLISVRFSVVDGKAKIQAMELKDAF